MIDNRQVVQKLEERKRVLLEQQENISRKISALDALIADFSHENGLGTKLKASLSQRYRKMKLTEAVLDVVSRKGTALRIPEIRDALIAEGYKPKTKHVSSTLHSICRNLAKDNRLEIRVLDDVNCYQSKSLTS